VPLLRLFRLPMKLPSVLARQLSWSKNEAERFPSGWHEERVRRVLAHYEEQTEEEAVAEDEAAFGDRTQTVMEIPNELVLTPRELIAKREAQNNAQ